MSLPKILCVDDEPNVLEGITLTLRRRYRVLTAPNGIAALSVLKSEPGITVIVSDMRMPGMNGARFLSHAREHFPDIPRILLTGQTEVDAAVTAVNEGQVVRFLTKPCDPATLADAIDAAYQLHRRSAKQAAATPYSVLIVDDSNTVRRRVRTTLESSGYDVTDAHDAPTALKMLARQVPDLVITDVNMGRMSGLELVAAIRHDHPKQTLPVLVMTTEVSDAMREQGRAVGANGWIVKPVEDNRLCAVVAHVIAGRAQ